MSEPSVLNERMELFGSKQGDGIVGQNKFGKGWSQTRVTARLVASYFNWIWLHSRTHNTAA